jgi:hypothetical protein
MRVIVCGSRRWQDRDAIISRLADLTYGNPEVTIVHGNAGGADKIAHQEAQKLGFFVEPHPADWQTHGKSAGYLRNEEMVTLGADLCIAFWDGKSKGTRHTMELACERDIPVEVIRERLYVIQGVDR